VPSSRADDEVAGQGVAVAFDSKCSHLELRQVRFRG
jgi:hypothetical protein